MEEESVNQEETEAQENLRQMIIQQLASMEPSDVSDDDSYQMRLSCILEDDESESSASQGRIKEFPKSEVAEVKTRERDKPTTESEESESSDNLMTSRDDFELDKVQVTDLDELSVRTSESPSEKTEIQKKTDDEVSKNDETEEEDEEEEEEEEEARNEVPFGIKKLKSSDNIFAKKMVPKRTEFSSDSSDIDISISNEKPCDVTVVGTPEDDTISTSPEGGESAENEGMDVDNPMFAKVTRSYLQKTMSREEVQEEENRDSRMGSVERELMSAEEETGDPKKILQVVQLRSKSPRVYTPPVPPETYLWEELKRIRGKGGYPWTYLDKPPFDEAAWKKYMEHEYEPINPPPLSVLRKQEKEQESGIGKSNESGIPESDRHFVRIKREVEPIKKEEKIEKDVEDTIPVAENLKTEEDMEVENIAAAQDIQDDIENRYFAQTPTTTTASRTDGDVNTSMLDSSGMEDLPLNRTTRTKLKNQGHGIHKKLRNQAGKIRNKFKNIPRPSLNIRERQKDEAAHDKPRFKLPERPKFSLPDRPKFKFPDRPKINLPDRPKFHLPERPKFHMPERPKLHLPERPKIHFPERPKFHLPERPKLHLPERPKLHFPERPKFNLPEMSKFHLPERPKLHFPERPKISLPSFVKPLRERQDAIPGERKNIFDLDLKSYPKIFTKKSKERGEYTTSSPKKTRGSTPPPKMRSDPAQPSAPERKKVPVGHKWLKNMDDIKYADDDPSIDVKDSRRSEHSGSIDDFQEKDLGGYMEDLDDSRFPPGGVKTLSTKSSMSHMSDRDVESLGSSGGRRKGVLEEIDSDEFFLRQKGISQEDIDMGKYLSHEIREAFRSPEVNALQSMNYDFEGMDVENEPHRPTRSRSLKKNSSLKKEYESDPALNESSGYKTYPPRRPSRKTRSQSKSLVNEEAVISEIEPTYQNEEDNVSEYYKSPGPVKEYEHYKVPKPVSETAPVPFKRTKSMKKKLEDVIGIETSVEVVDSPPPQPLTRKKSKRRLDGRDESLEERMSRGEEDEKLKEHEYIVPAETADEAPVPPRRTRSLSRSIRSSRSLRSVGLEESREAVTPMELPFEKTAAPLDNPTLSETEVPKSHLYETTEDDPGFGYATIGKPLAARPVRQKKEKPKKPSPPRRKKEIKPVFSTIPRRTPVRPIRNYSTLGPARPPRRLKSQMDDRLKQAYLDLEAPIKPMRFEECHGSLQKEEVIEKMKGRPLPPPPRPPRQKSKGPDDLPEQEEIKASTSFKSETAPEIDDATACELLLKNEAQIFAEEESDEAKISMALLTGDALPVEVEALVHPLPTEQVEEVCVSTQTDPLPDDFLLDVEESMIQEFSHDQLKMQQAFLEEMRREAGLDELETTTEPETERQKKLNERLELELLAELERERERERREKEEKDKELLEPYDADLGYASLDRKQHRQEPEPSTSADRRHDPTQPIHVPVIPDLQTSVKVLRTDKLDVRELEVERLNVREVQAQGINVGHLQTSHLTAGEVTSRSGNLSLGNIQLPPNFIQEIVDKIPWEDIRQSGMLQGTPTPAPTPVEGSLPVFPLRRHLQMNGSDEDNTYLSPPPRRHRRHRQVNHSSDEEDGRPHRRRTGRSQSPNISELGRQLVSACAASGTRTAQGLAFRICNANAEEKAKLLKVALSVIVLIISIYLMLFYESKTVLHHHWDFQFPPQPPPREL